MGGGGYDIWRVVPRAWSLIWLEMTEQTLSSNELPLTWIDKWQNASPVPLPTTWSDPDGMYQPIPRKAEIEEKNEHIVQKLLYPLRQERN